MSGWWWEGDLDGFEGFVLFGLGVDWAQLFLQVRTQVLNNDLAAYFQRWYPGFIHHSGVR